MAEPGVILYPARISQTLAFKGMKYGSITPTDIDAIIEYKDKGWIIYEIKHKGVEVPFGQKLLLERFVKDAV